MQGVISTRTHGVLDYAWGFSLLCAPRAFGLREGGAAERTAHVAGLGAILYAALTDYEVGLVPVLSMRQHLAIDVAAGAALAASPWLLGFAGRNGPWPHLAFGLFAVGAGLATSTEPAAPALARRLPRMSHGS